MNASTFKDVPPVRVYLAGRIRNESERFGIISSVDCSDAYTDLALLPYSSVYQPEGEVEIDAVNADGVFGTFNIPIIYTGPYTLSCDHRCSHVPAITGAAFVSPNERFWLEMASLLRVSAKTKGDDDPFTIVGSMGSGTKSHGAFPTCSDDSALSRVAWQEAVYRRSLDGIADCDVFFIWLEDTEAYGSLVELGYAKGLGKRIIMGSPKPRPLNPVGELWFAMQGVDCYYEAENPKVAFEKGLSHLYPDIIAGEVQK